MAVRQEKKTMKGKIKEILLSFSLGSFLVDCNFLFYKITGGANLTFWMVSWPAYLFLTAIWLLLAANAKTLLVLISYPTGALVTFLVIIWLNN